MILSTELAKMAARVLLGTRGVQCNFTVSHFYKDLWKLFKVLESTVNPITWYLYILASLKW